MAERNDIPRLNYQYTADDDRQLNELFTIEGIQYKFVRVPSGEFIRKGDAVFIDGEGTVTRTLNAGASANGIAKWNIDGLAADAYALVVWKGGPINVATPGTAVSSTYNQAKLVTWINGQMRCANANVLVSNSNAMITTPATSCTVGFQKTAASVFKDYLTEGDLIETNAGLRSAVALVINTNAIATTATTSVLAGAHLVYVNYAAGGISKSNMSCASANAVYEVVTVPDSGIFSAINVSSESTTLHVNCCAAGRIVKVGDIVNGPNSSTRIVTAIVNNRAVTINAAMNTETAGLIGSVYNVNASFVEAIVN